ncbi:MAG TPA: hypothetical protein VK921_11100 [Anditalea sp.]|nr:hypothetical protein [Anditalea sp.]
MIIRNDASKLYFFVPIAIGRDGRPMTEASIILLWSILLLVDVYYW